MEHCAPHTRAVHTAACLEREVAGRKNWKQLLELLPSGFSHVLWLKVYSHRLLRACLLGSKRSLSDFPVWSAVQEACSSLAPCTSVVRVFFERLSPLHFLCSQCLQPLQKMLLPTPVRNSPELCRRSSPAPQIMIFVFPAFTLSPFSYIASFQVIPRAIQ